MNDDQLLRYARHLLLDDVGVDGQARLLQSHALVIGAGGLGCAAAMYLCAAGVGRLTIVDHDVVDASNLQRQIAHTTARIGQPKAESAAHALRELNPGVHVDAQVVHADATWLDTWVPTAHIVIDGSDNFATRHAVNAACVAHGVPLVSGAALRMDAQLAVFDTSQDDDRPCYACVFAPEALTEADTCVTSGVLGPLVGAIGSLQAAEAIKRLLNRPSPLDRQLLMLDARTMQTTAITTARRADCPVCGTHRVSRRAGDPPR